jgi:hypothetical protein
MSHCLMYFLIDSVELSTVGFEKTTFEVAETSKLVSLPIVRSGDLASDVYVDCMVTTNVLHDGDSQRVLVKLTAGESHAFCDLHIGGSDRPIAGTWLRARLANPSSDDVDIASVYKEAIIRVISGRRDSAGASDESVISMARSELFTEEPSSSDACAFASVGIVRRGDVSRAVSVRVTPVADTALGDRVDFDDRATTAQFEVGARLVYARVAIMYDEVRETLDERFAVTLSLNAATGAALSSTRLGNLTTTFVHIRDTSPASVPPPRHLSPSLSQHVAALRQLFSHRPIVVPLDELANENSLFSNRSGVGQPLVCLHVNTTYEALTFCNDIVERMFYISQLKCITRFLLRFPFLNISSRFLMFPSYSFN